MINCLLKFTEIFEVNCLLLLSEWKAFDVWGALKGTWEPWPHIQIFRARPVSCEILLTVTAQALALKSNSAL